MSETLIWGGNSKQIHKINGNSTYPEIPMGIYELVRTMTGAYLAKVGDKFEFNYKLYGVEQTFIDHSMKSFESLTKNMGVLLSGLKGTGKTVTAKQLANLSGLPIILVNSNTIDALSYFNDIPQPLCFFFDEFEKIVKQDDQNMANVLSFVDGTITTQKHLMLFTSNTLKVNEYFIDRPGRIRYIKKFDSLKINVVKEIVSDKLNNKDHVTDLIEWVSYFKFLTIDLLTSIIDEINIHDVSVNEFKEFFNADNEKIPYEISYKITDPESKKSAIFTTNTIIKDGTSPSQIKKDFVGGGRSLVFNAIRGKLLKSETGNFDKQVMIDTYASSMYIGYNLGADNDSEDLIFTGYLFGDKEDGENEIVETDSDGNEYIQTFTNYDKTMTLYDGIQYQFEIMIERQPLYGNYTYVF